MDRILCEWCKQQSAPNCTHCENCGAPLDVKNRIRDPQESVPAPSATGMPVGINVAFKVVGPILSAAALLTSGQRVWGVLRSFTSLGTTPRSLGRTPSRPELLDAPHHVLAIDLYLPNTPPVTGQNSQPVPLAQVPRLAVGRQLVCAVDPAAPQQRFVVDWDASVQ